MRLAVIAFCCGLCACVTWSGKAAPPLPDRGPTGPSPDAAALPLMIELPTDEWTLVPPEQVPPECAAAVRNANGAFIAFYGTPGTPEEVAANARASAANDSGLELTPLRVSEDGSYARFGFVEKEGQTAKAKGRIGARRVAGLPAGFVAAAQGRWTPEVDAQMSMEFSYILRHLRVQ